MSEPRRPRVIRTKPGTPPVDRLAAPKKPQQVASDLPDAAAAEPVARSVSGKVTVTALPRPENASTVGLVQDTPTKPREQGAKKTRAFESWIPSRWRNQPKDGSSSSLTNNRPADLQDGANATVLSFPVPARLRRRKIVWLSLGAVAIVVAVVMVTAMFSPIMAVKTISFDGRKLVAEETLQQALAPLMNKPLPQVTPGEVNALLEKVPQVKGSWIEARPPSTLLVHLVERVPVALLKSDGEYLMVDQDGIQLGVTKDPAAVPLPLIDGGKEVIGKATFQAMTAVLATLPKSVLEKLASASAKSPDTVELQMVDGKVVVWGNASDRELKAQVLEALIVAPPPTVEPGKPQPAPVHVYDVSAPRHPVTR